MEDRRRVSICRDKETLGYRNCDGSNDVYRENVPSGLEADFRVSFPTGAVVCISLIYRGVSGFSCEWVGSCHCRPWISRGLSIKR